MSRADSEGGGNPIKTAWPGRIIIINARDLKGPPDDLPRHVKLESGEMHYRRIASLLLGFWLGGGLWMAWIAIASFRSVDSLLTAPGPVVAIQIKALGPGGAHALLRYQAAEQNRAFFETWEFLQLILAAGFFFFLLLGSAEGQLSLLLLLIMLVIVVAQRFFMTPQLSSLGRTFD